MARAYTLTKWAFLNEQMPPGLREDLLKGYFTIPEDGDSFFVIGTLPDGERHCSDEVVSRAGLHVLQTGKANYSLEEMLPTPTATLPLRSRLGRKPSNTSKGNHG